MNNFIHHKSGSNEYKNKQANITKLTLSKYTNRNIMVNNVSECVNKVSYQPNCTRLPCIGEQRWLIIHGLAIF